MSNSFTQSEESEKTEKDQQKSITDIYIGVFFDGTSNNMNKVKLLEIYRNVKRKDYKSIYSSLYDNITSDSDTNFISNSIKKIENIKLAKDIQDEDILDLNDTIATTDEYKLSELKKDNPNKSYDEKYSNVAFLTSLYNGNKKTGNYEMLNVYMEGSGATPFSDFGVTDKASGLAMGIGKTGVVSIVSRAMVFITRWLDTIVTKKQRSTVTLHFDVFGFSRGSACARVFSYMVCEGENSMARGNEFDLYSWNSELKDGNKIKFVSDFPKREVSFLGIYDTVASIGMLEVNTSASDRFYHKGFEEHDNFLVNELYAELMEEDEDNASDSEDHSKKLVIKYTIREVKNNFHRENVYNYGLYSPCLDKVINTLHIGAIDEYRENFAFTNIGKKVPGNAIEILIPGCHSDVGGGYGDGEENLVTLLYGEKRSKIDKDIKNNPNVIDSKISKISMACPGQPEKSELLTVEALQKLGWVWVNGENIVSNSFLGTGHSTSDRDDKIQFLNSGSKGGYSNIPLQMMIEQVALKLNDRVDVFEKSNHPRIAIPSDISTDMISRMKECSTGNRYCFCPGSFTSLDYLILRRKYLHFTSSDELNWGLHHNNLGNVLGANAPYRKEGVLGRLMYNGGKEDGSQLLFMNSQDCSFQFVNVNIKITK